GDLQLGLLVELVEQHLGVFVPLDLDDDPHPLPVGLVSDLGDPFDLLLLDQFGDLLDQAGLVDLVGEFGDDDRLALRTFGGLEMGLGADLDDAAAGAVRVPDPLAPVDGGAGREVGTRDHCQQLFKTDFRIPDHGDDAVNHLTQVVGRDVGGHADRDPGRAVDQQVGELGGEYRRL